LAAVQTLSAQVIKFSLPCGCARKHYCVESSRNINKFYYGTSGSLVMDLLAISY